MDHPLQTILSRTGSFPLDVAHRLLQLHAGKSSVVFDPFCGKGTSLFAARMLNHSAYGLDIAPGAVICAAAKLIDVNLGRWTNYVNALRLRHRSISDVPSYVKVFFHPATLSQILAIRDKFLRDVNSSQEGQRANAIFGLANLLGILHGHATYSLSLPCAHAFSMAPGYVKRYAQKHGLEAPIQNVKLCLIEKAKRCLRLGVPNSVASAVTRGCARSCSAVFPELVGKVDLILTLLHISMPRLLWRFCSAR